MLNPAKSSYIWPNWVQWHRYSATTYSHKSMLYGIHWIHRLHRLPDYQTPRLSKNPYRVQPLNPNPLKSCFRTAHKYPRKKIINIECPLHPHTNWVHLHNHPYSNAQLESKTNQIAQRYIFQKNNRTKFKRGRRQRR